MPAAFQDGVKSALFVNRENDYRNVVLTRKSNRGSIHDGQPIADHLRVAQPLVARRIRILARIGGIDAVDLRSLEKRIGADLGSP